MPTKAFDDLLDIIKKQKQKNMEMGRPSRIRIIPTDTGLAIALRIPTGSDIWGLVSLFRSKRSSVDIVLEDTITTIEKV